MGEEFQLCSASQRIPFGLGYWNNLEYILVAFGFNAGYSMMFCVVLDYCGTTAGSHIISDSYVLYV